MLHALLHAPDALCFLALVGFFLIDGGIAWLLDGVDELRRAFR